MEKVLQLCYPVVTPEGKELLPGGTFLTRDTLAELVASAPPRSWPSRRLLDYGSIAADLANYCGQGPYRQIFSHPSRRQGVFAIMNRVEMAEPLLRFYDYFRANDPYTYRHILTVFALSVLLAQDLIDDPEELGREIAAAPTHDFGKICVPLEVCRKTTLLTEHERQLLSHHAAAGYVLLSYFCRDPDHPAAVTARDHHERRNGTGYPRGAPLGNRIVEIVAVGDIFDALISPRPYRPQSYDLRTALEEVTRLAESGAVGTDVVRALIACNREKQPPYQECSLSGEKRGTPPAGNLYRGVSLCRYQPECAWEGAPKVQAEIVQPAGGD